MPVVCVNTDCCRFEFAVLRLRTIPFPRRHRRPFASLFAQASGFHSPKSLNAMSGPLKNSAACFCEFQNCYCQKEPAFATSAVESARCQLVARGILGASGRSRIGSRCSLMSVFEIVPSRCATAGPRPKSATQSTSRFRLRQPRQQARPIAHRYDASELNSERCSCRILIRKAA